MITTIVQFKFPEPIALEAARKAFSDSAASYQAVKGLIRKYYLLADDRRSGGGVYLWESRADADLFYSEEWTQFIVNKYGSTPSITYFDSPVVVDNDNQKIIGAIP